MDEFTTTTLLYTSLALFLIYVIFKRFSKKQQHYHLPPSPGLALPLIGHLHLLKPPIIQALQRVPEKYGPIISVKLGSRIFVVVSSYKLVEECFTKNDVVFSNRPTSMLDDYIGYDRTTLANAPYGPLWRSLRRLAATEVLSTTRVAAFTRTRQDEVMRTLKSLISPDRKYTKVEVRPKLFELFFNITMMMLAGRRYSTGDEQSERFRELMDEFFKHAHATIPEDFLPILRWIDFTGLKKKMEAVGKNLDEFYQGLLEDHRKEKRNTIIGHLLSLQESDPEFYSDKTIKGFLTSTIIGSTDTSVVTLEWTVALLLNHPHVLQKAKAELDSQIGHHRLLEEQDLPNLPYLRNIIYESLRLCPPGPFPLPRESSADCKLGGYDIPHGTTLLVNATSIHRNPKLWADPLTFKPERFEGREADAQQLMAFGMGRRSCPGMSTAYRLMGLALGSLIQCFDWERVNMDELIDLTPEESGLTTPISNPLFAMFKPNEIMLKVIQE
ncbi:cytochrome p450 81e8 [Phtheirospermum japonicum]|uniref:Flavonoid-6-hydroxylase n=1 Tax=Phtheirospermum japonicum TaxID=374723 RepID=A0A830CEC5_9LAMI|nr:cytochrome p450 81e8 [Phtheirospermum japonicum]